MTEVPDISTNPEYKLVDTWNTEGLGEVRVFFNESTGLHVLQKNFGLGPRFGALPEEMQILEARIKDLPDEVSLASGDYRNYNPERLLFNPTDNNQTIYFDYSTHNLKSHMAQLKLADKRFSDEEALGCFGFMIGLGSFMEQGLEFHRSVCLKNLIIVNGQLQLLNPYVSDSHISLALKEFIQPIVAMGEEWENDMFTDDQLRMEVS